MEGYDTFPRIGVLVSHGNEPVGNSQRLTQMVCKLCDGSHHSALAGYTY
jgi:hypothetical protein